jgi:hypothetical protein
VSSHPDSQLRIAGALFLVGGLVFVLGAGSPPWEQWSAPLPRALEVIAQHRAAWYWIHACFALGVLLTIFGFTAFAVAMADVARAQLLAALIRSAYLTGAALWLANIGFRVTVQLWAGTMVTAGSPIPLGYEAWQGWVDALFGLYMLLGYASCVGLGWIVLRTTTLPRWVGWFAIGFGVSAGGVVGASIPALVHLPLMIVGGFLVRRRGPLRNRPQ